MEVTFFDLAAISVKKSVSYICLRLNGPADGYTEIVSDSIDVYINRKDQAREFIRAGEEALKLLEVGEDAT